MLSLFKLIYQHPNAIFSSRETQVLTLDLMDFAVSNMIDALEAFFDKKYKLFDAQVGECLCQIRAYSIHLFSKDPKLKNRLEATYNIMKQKRAILEKERLRVKNLSATCYCRQSIKSYFIYCSVVFDVVPESLYLAECHFLARFCAYEEETGIPQSIDFSRMKLVCGFSKHMLKQLVSHYQKEVAKYSCGFVERISAEIGSEWLEACGLLKQVNLRSREVYPCFYVSVVLLKHMKQKKYPIGLNVYISSEKGSRKEEAIWLVFDVIDNEYQLRGSSGNKDDCAFVVQCYSELDVEFLKGLNLEHALLANMAQHPQFSCKTLNANSRGLYGFAMRGYTSTRGKDSTVLARLTYSYSYFLNFAQKYSYGDFEKPSLLMQHIYCRSMEKDGSSDDFLPKNKVLLGSSDVQAI